MAKRLKILLVGFSVLLITANCLCCLFLYAPNQEDAPHNYPVSYFIINAPLLLGIFFLLAFTKKDWKKNSN